HPGQSCPRQDSNLRTALRRRVLYPLSYGGRGQCSNGPSVPVRPRSPGDPAVIEKKLKALIREALAGAAVELGANPPEAIELTRPPQKRFGDFSTNVAIQWASRLKRNPAEVAAVIVHHMPEADFVSSVEVAGIGFINFHVVHVWLYDVLREVVSRGDSFGRLEPAGQRAQVEFVSANPTGPLHVGHARNSVLGDAIASVLEAAGYGVE